MVLKYDWAKRFAPRVVKLEEEAMFVHIREKHGDEFHIIKSEQDLVDVMLHYTQRWVNNHWLPREDWYFSGTYDEYFLKEMGITPPECQRVINMCEGMPIEAIAQMKEKAEKIKRAYFHEQDGLATAKFYRDVIDNGIGKQAGVLYNNLTQQTYNGIQMFNLQSFSKL